jgi:hypothetical protein
MLVERSGSAPPNWITPVAVMSMVSVPASALASWIASRSVQLPAPSSHAPSGVASPVSERLLTVKVVAARPGDQRRRKPRQRTANKDTAEAGGGTHLGFSP